MDSESSECSCEIVQVAIVNKDTLEDKMKEHALLAIVTGVCTLLVAQGIPWTINKLAAIKKARETEEDEKTKKD